MSKTVKVSEIVSILVGETVTDNYFVRITAERNLEVLDKGEKIIANAKYTEDPTFVDVKGDVVEPGLYSMALDRFKAPKKVAKQTKQSGGSPIGYQTRSMSRI